MRRIVFTYGLAAGALFVIFMLAALPLWKNNTITFENGDWIGYTSMVVAMSMIFFGVKSYRDKNLNGKISFGKGLRVGLLITAVASLGYAIGWELYLDFFAPDFIHKYCAFCISKARASGVSSEELQSLVAKMETTLEMYKNPFLRFAMMLMEVIPVGIIISFISAALLRKKQFLISENQ
jgi:hypothetical protein